MLVVTLTLHNALTGRRKVIGKLVVANDGTGSADVGHYDVWLGKGGQKVPREVIQAPAARGRVERHLRDLGAWCLLKKALQAVGA